ncbi:MAG TPA: hypothetical protein ENO14_01315 [Chromatiales bacterium]|nr:hypothetical protein [Chromatiales bacterium]
MRGEFIGVWAETSREIWEPLFQEPLDESGEVLSEDIFCELYRVLAPAFTTKPSIEQLAAVIDDSTRSRVAFEHVKATDLACESTLIGFFESVHGVLQGFEEPGNDGLTNRYFNLLGSFIEKFSLRYDLRRPCIISATLPGLVTSLVQHVRSTSRADAHLAKLSHEYEEALRDLRHGRTEARIKSCLAKQYILIEGIANASSGTSSETLGQRCRQASWPHPTLKAAAGNIYGFRSDYPGLGHAGSPKAVLRDVDERDLVGVSCMLLGVVPYVDSRVNLAGLYGDQALHVTADRGNYRDAPTGRPATSLSDRLLAWVGRVIGGR